MPHSEQPNLLMDALESLYAGNDLSEPLTREIFDLIVQGQVDDIRLSSLLTALKIKGETPQEIAGAVNALMQNAAPFDRPDYPFADVVGTGGDGHHTINISSATAIVAAACGIKVAKHGNRSVSSKSGSADLFAEFGLNLAMNAGTARQCLNDTNLCFLFAPNYHAGIRHAMPVRTTLKTRTLFNILGPLANPARPTHMMVGVYHPDLLEPYAKTLQLLGYKHAWVVHGSGLDELALHGPSQVVEVDGDNLKRFTLSPADFGLNSAPLDAIKGGEPAQNKVMVENILCGKGAPAHQDAVAMNTAALLKICGVVDDLKTGVQLAVETMQAGTPLDLVHQSARISQANEEANQ